MNKIIKCLYIIMLSTIFTNNTISMQQQEKLQLLNLPKELALHIINQALLSQIKKVINNSYNDIFNEHATIKFNLNEIKGFRDSSKYLYDLINNHLKSKSFKKIINYLKQERFDELLKSLKEQSKKEYKEWSIQDLNKALVDIVNEGVLISKEDLKTAVKLILAGADVNVKNKDGWTVLMWTSRGRGPLRKLSREEYQWRAFAVASRGYDPLSRKGYKEIVQILINKDANVNAADDNGNTALMWASENGHKEIVEILIKAKANVNAKNKSLGQTALIKASSNGYKKIVEILINKDANVNAADDNGNTALMWASENGHKEIVEILIKAKANVNAKNKSLGQTALIKASSNGYKKIVEILINKDANVNAADDNGNTALMWASENGHKEIVEILIKAGVVNIDKKCTRLRTRGWGMDIGYNIYSPID